MQLKYLTVFLILSQIYPSTIPDLCSERALIVCGRYKGDFPNTLKLRGIRADMTNFTIDIDVQQANDIPLIKVPFYDSDMKFRNIIADFVLTVKK